MRFSDNSSEPSTIHGVVNEAVGAGRQAGPVRTRPAALWRRAGRPSMAGTDPRIRCVNHQADDLMTASPHGSALECDPASPERSSYTPRMGKGARIVVGIGAAMLGLGLLMVLFVVYQLWGTALYTDHAQAHLKNELSSELHHKLPTTAANLTGTHHLGLPPLATAPAGVHPDPAVNSAIGLLSIPKIGLLDAIVEGVGEAQLAQGPGHYPGTPMPGEPGTRPSPDTAPLTPTPSTTSTSWHRATPSTFSPARDSSVMWSRRPWSSPRRMLRYSTRWRTNPP